MPRPWRPCNREPRRWFLTWGILVAVFGVRGVLPWLIVWIMTPGLGPWQAFTASLTGDAAALMAIQKSAPVLLMGGAVFFIFLFFHWIFVEPKKYGLPVERIIARQGAWFYAAVSILLTIIVWFALGQSPMLGLRRSYRVHGVLHYTRLQKVRRGTGAAAHERRWAPLGCGKNPLSGGDRHDLFH